jgi:hypothetical protein
MSNPIEEYLSTYTQTNYIFDSLSLVTIRGNRIAIKAVNPISLNKIVIPLHIQFQKGYGNYTRATLCQSTNPQIYITETRISSDFDVSIVVQSPHNTTIEAGEEIAHIVYLKRKPLLLLRKTRDEHKRDVLFVDIIICVCLLWVLCVIFLNM